MQVQPYPCLQLGLEHELKQREQLLLGWPTVLPFQDWEASLVTLGESLANLGGGSHYLLCARLRI